MKKFKIPKVPSSEFNWYNTRTALVPMLQKQSLTLGDF